MQAFSKDEEPLYHLLSLYNSKALTHVASFASFVVALFTFEALGLTGQHVLPFFGRFFIEILLCSGIFYAYFRTWYYSNLITLLTNIPIVDGYLVTNMFTAEKKLVQEFRERRKNNWSYRIGYFFRNKWRALLPSLLLGLISAVILSLILEI
jgi:hypothetical protein